MGYCAGFYAAWQGFFHLQPLRDCLLGFDWLLPVSLWVSWCGQPHTSFYVVGWRYMINESNIGGSSNLCRTCRCVWEDVQHHHVVEALDINDVVLPLSGEKGDLSIDVFRCAN